jgi:hypothetical protein
MQALRFFHLGHGFVISPQRSQMPGIPMVTRRVARIKVDSPPEFPPGGLPIPVEAI